MMSEQPSPTDANGATTEKKRYCDIVMEGGITSGVVYPWAVTQLADRYQFKNIGGTSAGAIAAAATAAAELGRAKGVASFQKLNQLPAWLGEPIPGTNQSHLFALFQPQATTRALFYTLAAFLGERQGKWQRVLVTALQNYPQAAILGLLPGLVLVILAVMGGASLLTAWGVVCGLLLGIIGLLLTVAAALFVNATRALPANFYGLCSGHNPDSHTSAQALTDWLTDYLDDLAGITTPACPLTFGDLWRGAAVAACAEDGTPARDNTNVPTERTINLQMITTNLSHGRPYTLPFDNHRFYFDPVEFRRLFPERVVTWLEKNAYQSGEDDEIQFNGHTLLRLPDGPQLPVVVATRMSLSFPVLLSAVPLYAIDVAKPTAPIAAKEKPSVAVQQQQMVQAPVPKQAERCWFSDGGITVNFPLHFFDQPMPRWPTFGIDLQTPRPEYVLATDQRQNVWMPEDNHSGTAPQWTYFEPVGGFNQLIAFGAAIFHTARTWQINTLMTAPGYRDRVAHVYVGNQEGGLNLNMPAEHIQHLSERGQQAGAMFVERFADSHTTHNLSWANHRWVRYRTAMAVLESMLQHMQGSYHDRPDGDLSYAELISRAAGVPPKSYPWAREAQQQFADATTRKLIALADEWGQSEQCFSEESPKPIPGLEIRPRV